MATALDIARHLIRLGNDEPEPARLTNLHVQKLLYYVQGWGMVSRGSPTFNDRIEAWTYGPVVQSVYSRFSACGNQPIPADMDAEPDPGLTDEDKSFVASIWNSYKVYSAIGLSEMTHKECPWKDAYDVPLGSRCRKEITTDSLRRFFSQVYGKNIEPGHPTLEDLEKMRAELASNRSYSLDQAVAMTQ